MGKEKKAKDPNKLGLGNLLLWNSRSVSISILNLTIGTYMLLYCNTVLGLDTAVVSMMLVLGKVLDGVTDSVAGLIVDRTKTKWGKGRPYEVFIVLGWLCVWLMYSTPTGLSTMIKYVWVFITYTLANSICYTFLNANALPYMVRAYQPGQIVKLTSYSAVITMLGAAIFNIFGPSLFDAAGTSASAWSSLVGVLAAALAVIGILRMFTIKETIDVEATSTVKTDKVGFRDMLELVLHNKYVVMLFLMGFVFNFVTNLGVGTYYYTYVVGSLSLLGIASAAQMLAIPLAFCFPALLKKFNVSTLMMTGFFVSAFGYVINFFAVGNVPMLAIAAVFTGVGTIPASFLPAIAQVECADYNEWQGRPRMEGTMSSLQGLATKIGAALGTGALGIILSVSGVSAAVAAITAGTIESLSSGNLIVIRLLFSLVPAVLYVIVGLTLSRYDLGKKIGQIREELAARRADMGITEDQPQAETESAE